MKQYISNTSVTLHIELVNSLLMKTTLTNEVVNALLNAVKIPRHLLSDRNARVSLLQYCQLLDAIREAMSDELLGHGEAPLPKGSMSLLAHWLITAENLHEAAQKIVDYFKIIGKFGSVTTYTLNDQICIEIEDGVVSNEQVFLAEYALVITLRFLSWLAREPVQAQRVDVSWQQPCYADDYQFMFLGTPVNFNQSATRLVLSPSTLDKTVNQRACHLKKFLANPVFGLLFMDFKVDELSTKVAAEVKNTLHMKLSFPEFSERVGLKPHILQRKLAREGTTYLTIKNQVKRDVALDMLLNSTLTIEEISAKLGFSESSPFTRTFKGWTGLAPSDYRKHKNIAI